jgi:hypothetical protein
MPQPKQSNPTISETPVASPFNRSRHENYRRTTLVHLLTAIFSISRAINLGSSRSSLAGIKTPLGVRLVKMERS